MRLGLVKGRHRRHPCRAQGGASWHRTLDLLDLRPGYPKNARATYAPKTVGQISPTDGFHFVIVATKHYQAAQAIRRHRRGAHQPARLTVSTPPVILL